METHFSDNKPKTDSGRKSINEKKQQNDAQDIQTYRQRQGYLSEQQSFSENKRDQIKTPQTDAIRTRSNKKPQQLTYRSEAYDKNLIQNNNHSQPKTINNKPFAHNQSLYEQELPNGFNTQKPTSSHKYSRKSQGQAFSQSNSRKQQKKPEKLLEADLQSASHHNGDPQLEKIKFSPKFYQEKQHNNFPANNNEIYFRETSKRGSSNIKNEESYSISKLSKQSKTQNLKNQMQSNNSISLSGKQGSVSSKIQLGRMKKKIKNLEEKLEQIINKSEIQDNKINEIPKISQNSMEVKKRFNNSLNSGAVNITMSNFYPNMSNFEPKLIQKRSYENSPQRNRQAQRFHKDFSQSQFRKHQLASTYIENPQDNKYSKDISLPNFSQKNKNPSSNYKASKQYNATKPQYDGTGMLKHENPSNLPKICQNQKNINQRPPIKYNNNNSNFPKRQKNTDFFPINSLNLNPHQQIIKDIMTSKRQQRSLGLKGFNKYKIEEKPIEAILNGQPNSKLNRFNTQDDRASQASIKTGKKIYQVAFGARKVNIPDQKQDPVQNIKIPSEKERILQPLKLDQYLTTRNPTMQMTPQQLTQIGKNAFEKFEITITEDTDFKMIKYKNCIIYSVPKVIDKHILWHYNGKFYYGDWIVNQSSGDGEKTGWGIEYMPDKYIYKGQFFKNKRNGTGKIMYQNGNIYEGQWIDGEKHGNGKLFEKQTQGYYDGQWKNNKRDGFGILIISDNQYYSGTFISSVKHGFGTEKFSNGDQYRGEYFEGKFHGKGKYIWKNGAFYQGKFQHGKRNGFGIWRSGMKGGQMYMGQYKLDKKQGQGKYVWQNGSFFEGVYVNDIKNGPGRLVDQNLKQTKGIWKNGKLIETATIDSSDDNYNNQDNNNFNRTMEKQSKRFEASATFENM